MAASRLFFVLGCGLCVVVGSARASLLTRNTGFEDANTHAWSLGGSCTLQVDPLAHDGIYGGHVSARTQPWDGPARLLSQEMNLVAGTHYAGSIWVRQDARDAANLTLVVKQSDDAGLRYFYLDVVAVPRGVWVRLSGVFAYEPTGTLDRLTMYVGTVGGEGNDQIEFRVDDVAVVVPGDSDGDADVDLADLALLLTAFGGRAGDAAWLPACDFDADGRVGLADLALLLQYFGDGSPG